MWRSVIVHLLHLLDLLHLLRHLPALERICLEVLLHWSGVVLHEVGVVVSDRPPADRALADDHALPGQRLLARVGEHLHRAEALLLLVTGPLLLLADYRLVDPLLDRHLGDRNLLPSLALVRIVARADGNFCDLLMVLLDRPDRIVILLCVPTPPLLLRVVSLDVHQLVILRWHLWLRAIRHRVLVLLAAVMSVVVAGVRPAADDCLSVRQAVTLFRVDEVFSYVHPAQLIADLHHRSLLFVLGSRLQDVLHLRLLAPLALLERLALTLLLLLYLLVPLPLPHL